MEVKTKKPPGKRLLKNMPLKLKWLLCAIIGLALIGYGLCVFSEAGNLKHTNQPFTRWFLLGTYSLVVINAGISIFGQAIIFRIRMENRKKFKRFIKKEKRRSSSSQELKPTIIRKEI